MTSKSDRLEAWAILWLLRSAGLSYKQASETSLRQFNRLVLEAKMSESPIRLRFARRFS